MKIQFRYLIILASFFFLMIHGALAEPSVAVLESESTRRFTPNEIFNHWEMDGVFDTLKNLQIPYQVLHDNDLIFSALSNYRLLILPNSKDISPEGVKAIEAFAEKGGKVFATGFSSYRNEQDQPATEKNNFQLSNLFGADYLRFNTIEPSAGAIRTADSDTIVLGRNTAIQVHLHPGTLVLGEWLNDDLKKRSFPVTLDAAIVENSSKNSIYAGENLFAPENSNNPQVKKLIGSLLNRLLPSIQIPQEIPFSGYPKLPEFGTIPLVGNSKTTIEVGLPFQVGSGFVTSESRFSVLDAAKHVVLSPRKDSMIAFSSNEDGFIVAGRHGNRFYFRARDLKYPLKIVLWHGDGSPLAPFKFGAFRDTLILKRSEDNPTLVNQLYLQSYLAGVVSHEVPFHFHREALKAMAVVARTFALKEIKGKKFSDYDICATVACQAYEGLAYEAPSSREAVEATENKTLTYHGNLAELPYYATCGGITEDIEKAWNLSPVPYLRSVVDGEEPIHENLSSDSGVETFLSTPQNSFCKASSRYRWRETYSAEELAALFKVSLPVLLKRSVDFSTIKSMEVSGRTPHGRVTSLKIVTDRETVTIGKDQIRWLFSGGQIGLGGLQSTFFVLLPERDSDGTLLSVTILGGGWGHGVGLCQFGAEGMAAQGYTYEKILSHYFPGTSLK